MAAKISRVFGVLCGGSINALITLCYAIGYGLMIFSDSLERYASVGIPSLLIGVSLVGLVITLWISHCGTGLEYRCHPGRFSGQHWFGRTR
jgi:hypothetical protein